MPDLNITLVQPNVVWENISQNLDQYDQMLSEVSEKSDLIILPEMFSTGFSMQAAKLAEPMDGKTVSWMEQLANKTDSVVCGSLIIKDGERFFNRLIWMPPGGTLDYYDKRHLFSMAGEDAVYSAGKQRLITTINDWKICPQVCYDLRFPVWNRNRQDYDLLIMVANWPERRVSAWSDLLLARAHENQAYVCGVNRVGKDGNGIYHSGASVVIDPKGQKLFSKDHDAVVHTETLSHDLLLKYRSDFPLSLDADKFQINTNQ